MFDKLYEDFTNILLPKISEGLVIAKDYFMDLFGRYIQYLIVIDSIKLIVGTLLLIAFVVFLINTFKKYKTFKKSDECYDSYEEVILIWFSMFTIICFISGLLFFSFGASNLAKDIYVPEVRVYEIIKLKTNN